MFSKILCTLLFEIYFFLIGFTHRSNRRFTFSYFPPFKRLRPLFHTIRPFRIRPSLRRNLTTTTATPIKISTVVSATKNNIYRRYRPTFAVTPRTPGSTSETVRNVSVKFPTRQTFQTRTTALPKREKINADQILLPTNPQLESEENVGFTDIANYNTKIISIPVSTISTTPRTRVTPTILPLSTRKIILKTINPSPFTASIPTRQSFSASEIMEHIPEHSKVLIHSSGAIQCLDQGNFPHPVSCKKFISCAKMETGKVVGWEYTCPKQLSFDPVGGMCNWSADLGCGEM